MAELHVQRKETNVWPWIVGAFLVAAVVWYMFMRTDTTRNVTSSTTADSMYQTQPTQGTASGTPRPGTTP